MFFVVTDFFTHFVPVYLSGIPAIPMSVSTWRCIGSPINVLWDSQTYRNLPGCVKVSKLSSDRVLTVTSHVRKGKALADILCGPRAIYDFDDRAIGLPVSLTIPQMDPDENIEPLDSLSRPVKKKTSQISFQFGSALGAYVKRRPMYAGTGVISELVCSGVMNMPRLYDNGHDQGHNISRMRIKSWNKPVDSARIVLPLFESINRRKDESVVKLANRLQKYLLLRGKVI